MMRVDEQIERFLTEQRKGASDRRKEMLEKDLAGELLLLKEVLVPVLGSLEDVEMEYELTSMSGFRIYADFCLLKYRMILEVEGFVVHAESITRSRFDTERMRIRTFAEQGYIYVPFTWDELVKQPDVCRRALYAIIGRLGGEQSRHSKLSVRENAVLRYMLLMKRSICLADVRRCLRVSTPTCRRVLKSLIREGYLMQASGGPVRIHTYQLTEAGRAVVITINR